MRQSIAERYIQRFNLSREYLYAWGRKPSAKRAEQRSLRTGKPLIRLEDGFLRSMGLGHEAMPLSICVDDLGIYYDCTRESRLERLIQHQLTLQEKRRTQELRKLWQISRASKYNNGIDSATPETPYVLVVDQTRGDCSIRYGMADGSSFQTMLEDALKHWPSHSILLKTHPDVTAGRKKGHFSRKQLNHPRLQICSDGGGPSTLIEHASAVYVVSSQVGFEALLWGKPVYTYGLPFYAGWGLTHDRCKQPERRANKNPSLEQLIHAALIEYPRYVNPETLKSAEPEEVIAWIADQKRCREAWPDRIEAFGFTPWKARQLRRFIHRYQHQTLRFRRKGSTPSADCQATICWGASTPKALNSATIPLIRVEDGFIRSRGLGANLVEAQSWIFDQQGLHYDGSRASGLETALLCAKPLNDKKRQRIRALLNTIQQQKISKYNLSGQEWSPPPQSVGREIIVVLGQVEDDASIRMGIPKEAPVRSNRGLLLAAREEHPQAWLVYKPHPDVCAGMRRQQRLECLWDELADEICIHSLLRQADEVCVMTSLGGFEAALQGVRVRTWGVPFYAGWGFTVDMLEQHPWLQRRTHQKLDLETFAYTCLIDYPTYASLRSLSPTSPERVIEEIQAGETRLNAAQWLFRWWGALKSKLPKPEFPTREL